VKWPTMGASVASIPPVTVDLHRLSAAFSFGLSPPQPCFALRASKLECWPVRELAARQALYKPELSQISELPSDIAEMAICFSKRRICLVRRSIVS